MGMRSQKRHTNQASFGVVNLGLDLPVVFSLALLMAFNQNRLLADVILMIILR